MALTLSNGALRFSMGYVLRVTLRHMLRAIEISAKKTSAALQREKDPFVIEQIAKTLSVLHELRSLLEGFKERNKNVFKDIK